MRKTRTFENSSMHHDWLLRHPGVLFQICIEFFGAGRCFNQGLNALFERLGHGAFDEKFLTGEFVDDFVAATREWQRQSLSQ